MKQQVATSATVLSRVGFGEADRIITLLTPDRGKISVIAKGVRKHRSKLAGGVELFSTANITYIEGRGDVATLASSRLIKHYDKITSDIERVQLGYELIKLLNKITEDNCEASYYDLLVATYEALNDVRVKTELIRSWFRAQLLDLAGHRPNLLTDSSGQKLLADKKYKFNIDDMTFFSHDNGDYSAGHIRALRLLFTGRSIDFARRVNGFEVAAIGVTPLVGAMFSDHLNT